MTLVPARDNEGWLTSVQISLDDPAWVQNVHLIRASVMDLQEPDVIFGGDGANRMY
jgi:hypothetical protein